MIKVTMFSNYLNHHQLPFCLQMQRLTEDNFVFVTEKSIATKRIGTYDVMDKGYSFLLKSYENIENKNKAFELSDKSDCVLIGHSDDKYIMNRLKDNKITFKCDERPFKEKIKYFGWLRSFRRIYLNHGRLQKYPIYMLCEGVYVAGDFMKYGAYKNRTYKWGYFPETIEYNPSELMHKKNKGKLKILWAGRLIDWKHPEIMIDLANKLKENNYKFEINIIGTGVLESSLLDMIKERKLENYVNLLGPMSPKEVRKYMEESSIYVFTSDKQEGWGAVLNEAMNSGCACVASHAIGSVGFLIDNDVNGIIYKDGNFDDLYQKVKALLDNSNKRESIGINAYKTITETWNAKVAAERLLVLYDSIKNNKETPFIDGPCSIAKPYKEKNMYEQLTKKYENCRD